MVVNKFAAISDDMVAHFIKRGDSTVLVIHKAEICDPSLQVPAKSIEIHNRDGIIALRDMLNDALGE